MQMSAPLYKSLITLQITLYKMCNKCSFFCLILSFLILTTDIKICHLLYVRTYIWVINQAVYKKINKNYYVVRNAGCAHSRYTLKLSLIF